MDPLFLEFESLLLKLAHSQASDLFLGEGRVPSCRLDGEIQTLNGPASSREFIEVALRTVLRPEQYDLFTKEGDIDAGFTHPAAGRFRLNAHLHRRRPAMVLRKVPSGALSFEELSLPESLKHFAELKHGLILVTGATGSGKSTTLAAMVHHINANFARHIVTIEDPVEFVHEDLRSLVTQREVGGDTRDFPTALRHVLRESPDVIVLGEMRDEESVTVAIAAALTGHLVISTLHTVDAAQTLQRILGFFPEHTRAQAQQDLSLCLEAVVAQRLLPLASGTGRIAAVEVLTITPAVRRLVHEGRTEEIPELLGAGLYSFNQALVELFKTGRISLETGLQYAPDAEDFLLKAQGMERGSIAFLPKQDELSVAGKLDMRSLLHSAKRHGASDLHLAAGTCPMLRIQGKLCPLDTQQLTATDVRHLLLSLLNHAQKERFELEKELDFAISLPDGVRLRINAHYQRQTVAVSIRLIPNKLPPIESLGLPAAVRNLAQASQGLVLITGPTGSGKSTTLATLIDCVNSTRNCRIITVEDPIEFIHANRLATIEQREVGADTKSFADALKYVLRQDPDIILVGEMRDTETIQAALTAAETGHLVLATLHTNDAPQAVERIIDVFPSYQQNQVRAQLASALLAVVSQRLIPTKEEGSRAAAFEILLASSAVRTMIRESKTHQMVAAIEMGLREGMQTLDRSLETLVREGRITMEEASRHMRNADWSRQHHAESLAQEEHSTLG